MDFANFSNVFSYSICRKNHLRPGPCLMHARNPQLSVPAGPDIPPYPPQVFCRRFGEICFSDKILWPVRSFPKPKGKPPGSFPPHTARAFRRCCSPAGQAPQRAFAPLCRTFAACPLLSRRQKRTHCEASLCRQDIFTRRASPAFRQSKMHGF